MFPIHKHRLALAPLFVFIGGYSKGLPATGAGKGFAGVSECTGVGHGNPAAPIAKSDPAKESNIADGIENPLLDVRANPIIPPISDAISTTIKEVIDNPHADQL